MTTLAASMLRDGLLEGSSVLIAGAPVTGAPVDSPGAAVAAACAELGARVSVCTPVPDRVDGADRAASPGAVPTGAAGSGAEGSATASSPAAGDEAELRGEAAEAAVKAALAGAGALDLLIVDCAGLFAHALLPDGGGRRDARANDSARTALRDCLQDTWNVTRAVANLAFLPGQRGGRIAYLAPAPDAGDHADAARAGLENLARTISVEWARHAITSVTIAPGKTTSAAEVAAVTSYLASPAGAYFSGCLLDLRASLPVKVGEDPGGH
jgi:NAD(P)-dependent dehydrogenase (short-subunit alcohol dehydrogenase family)